MDPLIQRTVPVVNLEPAGARKRPIGDGCLVVTVVEIVWRRAIEVLFKSSAKNSEAVDFR